MLLHSGFQFGPNVHTLALVLMILVIVSGLYGVFVYLKYPTRLSRNRDGDNRSELLVELEDIDRRSRRLAEGLGQPFQEVIASGVRRTLLGGSIWARLRGQDRSQIMLPQGEQLSVVNNAGQEAMLDWLAGEQSRSSDAALAAAIGELSALLRNKRKLLKQLSEDLRLQATLEFWLYLHVPLSIALPRVVSFMKRVRMMRITGRPLDTRSGRRTSPSLTGVRARRKRRASIPTNCSASVIVSRWIRLASISVHSISLDEILFPRPMRWAGTGISITEKYLPYMVSSTTG